MTNNSSKTTLPLGAYLNIPDASDPSTEAIFEANYASFTSLMGISPQFIDNYVDYTQPISAWVNNAAWAAQSYAQAPNVMGMTPVIGLPLASIAAGSSTPDAQFQAFASGKYDNVIQSVLQSWVTEGFTNLIFRPGWEMNVPGPTYAGDDAQSQADWVAAFQHVYTVLHKEATLLGVNVQVVWNPGTINYTNAEATKELYPGNGYVDIIGADVLSDMYRYSDTSGTLTYHDWDTGGEDTSVAQFIADPINRAHYWTFPAATEWSNDSSGGHSQSLDSLIQFAEQQGKPFAIPETGAGNSNAGTDVSDDAAFPQWLASQLAAAQASGEEIDFVNIWDSNGAGNYEFSNNSDNKPQEAAAWAQYFGALTPAPVITGSGSDTLVLSIAEDAWANGDNISDAKGDAAFTVSVDGKQLAGTFYATASHSAGVSQNFTFKGDWTPGGHTVTVAFLNDAWGGTASTDRNLYVNDITYDGTDTKQSAALYSNGSQSFSVTDSTAIPPVITGSGSDTLVLSISEDAWANGDGTSDAKGDAAFTVSVDGKQLAGTFYATASHSAGASQNFTFKGDWAPGAHTVTVAFLNDAWGGTASTDRNLYVNDVTYDGTDTKQSAALYSNGSQSFSVTDSTAIPPVVTGGGSDSLLVKVSEDYYLANAQFTVSVDGKQLGGTFTATTLHSSGNSQTFAFAGDFGSGQHTVSVKFLNDAWAGTPATDRNLYVNDIVYNGTDTDQTAALMSAGAKTFSVSGGTTPVGQRDGRSRLLAEEPVADRHLHRRWRHLRAQQRQRRLGNARHRGQPGQVRRSQLGHADRRIRAGHRHS